MWIKFGRRNEPQQTVLMWVLEGITGERNSDIHGSAASWVDELRGKT